MKLVIHIFVAAIVAMSSLPVAVTASSSAVTSASSLETEQTQPAHSRRRLDKKEKKKKKKKDKKNSTSSKSNKDANSTSSKSNKYTNSTKSGKYLSMDGKSSKATTTNGTANASKSAKAKDSNSTNATNAKGGAKSVKMNVMRSSSSMSMSMVVVYDDDDESPTLAPTLLPTMMPTTTIKLAVEDDVVEEEVVEEEEVVDDDDTAPVVIPVPICPTPYDITKTSYIGGSKVEMTSHIFECHSLYVQYCNIGTWDDSLLLENENAEELWSNAWVHVGPCSLEEDEAEEDEVVVLPEEAEDEIVVLPEAVVTEVPTTMPTFSPTLLPTTGVDVVADAESAAVEEEEEIPPICPADYDTTKTDYIGGDLVTVDSSIFECHSLYVQYCNIAEWDDSLLVGNGNAEDMWDNSWVFVGPCVSE